MASHHPAIGSDADLHKSAVAMYPCPSSSSYYTPLIPASDHIVIPPVDRSSRADVAFRVAVSAIFEKGAQKCLRQCHGSDLLAMR